MKFDKEHTANLKLDAAEAQLLRAVLDQQGAAVLKAAKQREAEGRDARGLLAYGFGIIGLRFKLSAAVNAVAVEIITDLENAA